MALQALNRCLNCSASFTSTDFSISKGEYLMTTCFHVFHQNCLSLWATSSKGSCPTCRHVCYQHQAGKDLTVVWDIFVEALQKMPETTLQALHQASDGTTQCSTCLDPLPNPQLFFDQERKGFVHPRCSPSTSRFLTLQDVIRVVQACAKVNSELSKALTPSPPSFYQIVTRDYRKEAIGVVIAGTSACATIFNYFQPGQNPVLKVAAAPVALLIQLPFQGGRLLLNLLNA